LLPRRPLLQAALAVWHWALVPLRAAWSLERTTMVRWQAVIVSCGRRKDILPSSPCLHLHLRRERYGYPRAYASQARHGLAGYSPTGVYYYCTTLLPSGSGCACAPGTACLWEWDGPRGSRSGAVDELRHSSRLDAVTYYLGRVGTRHWHVVTGESTAAVSERHGGRGAR
jgi:hypothetical protein